MFVLPLSARETDGQVVVVNENGGRRALSPPAAVG
jgi:hypothetical protein